MAKRLEHAEREGQKWKQRYDEERADAQKREAAFAERIREMRENEKSSQAQLEQAHLKFRQIEKHYTLFKETAEHFADGSADAASGLSPAQIATLMQSYNDLAQNYDVLLRQLAEKSEELQAVVELRAQSEKEGEERIRGMEDRLRREQEEADKARRRLADMEKTHLALLQSYRELNDRFIQARQADRPTSGPGPWQSQPTVKGSRERR